ncbi:leucine-rich repeat-containing protein 74A-like [Acanthochromis polyacanthus]|uniref:leucine-rich repeat-containing protein 74A-like n=1 Tax=Acanthochromis polyacanthus TaxID=80966 RepID=UPI0022348B40|nr:leucine-rich repeat-containing protein 74A-like [Acanthochromis polyacanthus]
MDELEEKKEPPGQSVQSTEDQKKSTQDQDGGSSDEWDTDLETDGIVHLQHPPIFRLGPTTRTQSLSRTELYLQACRQARTVPVSSFIRNLDKTDLNLNHYGMGPQGVKALARALENDTVITHLELEDNSLGAEGIRHLVEMLDQNATIQSLNLSNNQLGYKGAKIISKFQSNNYDLKYIKLSDNGFDASAAKCLADALRGDYVVKELDLSHNKFCEQGGKHLGHMLETNAGIEELNLSWSLHSVVDLCAGLELNLTLKRLYLTHNKFGHSQAKSLGQALKVNSTLVLLDLSDNLIDDEAVTPLCQGLASNITLVVLKLSNNPVTNLGATTLLKTVVNNTESALKDVDISGVFVHEAFIELLQKARQGRPALNVQYGVMDFVTRNLSALPIFKKFLEEQNLSITDFFKTLDKDGTMKVPTSVFRRAVMEANLPLDQRQRAYLVRQFDKIITGTIAYRSVWQLDQQNNQGFLVCQDRAHHLQAFSFGCNLVEAITCCEDFVGPAVTTE